MEFKELSELLFGLVTAIGTVAVTPFNPGQTRKVRAELLAFSEDIQQVPSLSCFAPGGADTGIVHLFWFILTTKCKQFP
ncbi:hypothetical protein [Endozoicomonas sp. 8E]|uniref:hypothetical protein n=1 Tax=Endozoicomonas sp. 8E TaxID=3035692 RepID=UPI002938D18E|nr:hypothetical protein [Endozoicomonas sp. 8E]WOG28685.1 hypothetical protein P6910_03225 [Endozoicomonas sp. 8E]